MRLSRCLYHMLRVWRLCTAVSSSAHYRRDAPASEACNKLLIQLCISCSICFCLQSLTCAEVPAAVSQARLGGSAVQLPAELLGLQAH